MKKVLLTLLGIVVVVGVLAGAGFAGYRMGYNRGALASSDGTVQVAPWGKGFGLRDMPMHNFGNNFDRGFNTMPGRQGLGMMDRGMRGGGFGFFSPFHFLARIAIFGILIWLAYKLFTGNGWKLALTRQPTQSAKTETQEPDSKDQ